MKQRVREVQWGEGCERCNGCGRCDITSRMWSTHLKGSQFVTVAVDGGNVFAATYGHLFCLDPSTGYVRWTNELKGFGYGLVSIAGADSSPLLGEYRKRQEASHTSAS